MIRIRESSILILIFLIASLDTISCRKVKERYPGIGRRSARMLLPFFRKEECEQLLTISVTFDLWKRYFIDPLNTTTTFSVEDESIGSKGGNCNKSTGRYDGLLGALQRNETDFMPMFMRSETLACDENLTAGPVFTHGDYIIISNTDTKSNPRVDFDLLSFLSSMDSLTYYYFSILLLILLFGITIKECADAVNIAKDVEAKDGTPEGNEKPIHKIFMKHLCKNVWNMYDLFLSQEGYYVNISMTGLLWFLILVFIVFYTFFCVLVNFMTTQRLVVDPIRKIDTTDDLFDMMITAQDGEIGRNQPVIFRGIDPDDIYTKTSADSNMGRIWNVIKDRPYLHMNLDIRERSRVIDFCTKLTYKLVHHEWVMVYNSFIYPNIHSLVCSTELFRDNAKSLHSSAPISAGVNIFIMNAHTPRPEKTYLEYALRNMFEFDLFFPSIKVDMTIIAPHFLPSYSVTKGTVCEAMGGKRDDDEGRIDPVGIKSYMNMFHICQVIVVVSLGLLLFEILFSKLINTVRRRNTVVPVTVSIELSTDIADSGHVNTDENELIDIEDVEDDVVNTKESAVIDIGDSERVQIVKNELIDIEDIEDDIINTKESAIIDIEDSEHVQTAENELIVTETEYKKDIEENILHITLVEPSENTTNPETSAQSLFPKVKHLNVFYREMRLKWKRSKTKTKILPIEKNTAPVSNNEIEEYDESSTPIN